MRACLLVLTLVLFSCQTTTPGTDQAQLIHAGGVNPFTVTDLAATRAAAKPLETPIDLRLRALNGPVSFQKIEALTLNGIVQPLTNSNFLIKISPKHPEAIDVSLAARSGGTAIEIVAHASFNNRGMKLDNTKFELSDGSQFSEAEGDKVRLMLDGIMGMMFPAAGRRINSEGDILYSMNYEGIIPDIKGLVRSVLVGESVWEGRSVLIGETSGFISADSVPVDSISGEFSGIEIIDVKSSLIIASTIRLAARSKALGKIEGQSEMRIEKSSIAHLP